MLKEVGQIIAVGAKIDSFGLGVTKIEAIFETL